MKKLLCTLLVGALLTTAIFAADTEKKATVINADGTKTVTVSLDTIEEVMTDYSPAMKKIIKDRDAAKSQYHDIKSQMDDLQEGIKHSDLDTGYQLTQKYEALEDSGARAKLAWQTADEQYKLNVYQQVNTAKQQYLGYSLDQSKLENLNAQLEAQKQSLWNAQKLVEGGYLSPKAYDAMTQTTESMVDSVRAQQTVIDADIRNLRVSLGVPKEAKLVYTVPDLSQFAFSQIADYDLDKDTQAMLENSVQLKNAKLTYESYRDNDYAVDAQTDAAKIAWEQAQKSAIENMKTLYQNLQDGYHALLTSRAGLQTQKATLAAAEAKYEHGYLSAKSLTDLRNQTATMETGVKAQEITLYSNLLTYQQMKTV